MKHCILFIAIFPSLLFSQITDFEVPDACKHNPWPSNIISLVATSEGHRAFVQFDCKVGQRHSDNGIDLVSGGSADIPVNIIYVIDYTPDFQPRLYARHVLCKIDITKAGLISDPNAPVLAYAKDLITYEGLLMAAYPGILQNILNAPYKSDSIFPYYESQLKFSNFKGKILGFDSRHFTSETQNTHIKLDWEDSYNGEQDRNNYWINIASAACPKTGKVLALNGKKLQDKHVNQNKELEWLYFDKNGTAHNRQTVNRDTPWAKRKDKAHYILSDGQMQLDYLLVISKQNSNRNENRNLNLNQFRLTVLSSSADVVYDNVLDIDDNAYNIDSIITYNNYEVLFTATRQNTAYLVHASPEFQYYTVFDKKVHTDIPSGNLKLKGISHYGNQTCLIYQLEAAIADDSGFVVFVSKAGVPVASHFIKKDKAIISDQMSIEFIATDIENPLILIKQYVRNGAGNAPALMPSFYMIKDAALIDCKVDFRATGKMLDTSVSTLSFHNRSVLYKGKHYIMCKNILEGPDGRNKLINTLSQLCF